MIYNPAQQVNTLLNTAPLVSPSTTVDSLDNNPSA